MEEDTRQEFEKLAAMVASGLAELGERLTTIQAALEKNLHETQYLDRKLDNRFDLLERMLFDNIRLDRDRIATVETSVAQLTKV